MNKYLIFGSICIILSGILFYYGRVGEKEHIDIPAQELTGYSCDFVFTKEEEKIESKEQPFLTGAATWYDYDLNITNGTGWSKRHDTCALRIYDRYEYYKVCLKDKDTCITCYHNDYGPQEWTYKVIDLSSHAFQQLAPLKKGVILVDIYRLGPKQ